VQLRLEEVCCPPSVAATSGLTPRAGLRGAVADFDEFGQGW
jgi:hypothetical protein